MGHRHDIETALCRFIQYQACVGRTVQAELDLLDSGVLDPLLLHDLLEFVESTYEIRLAEEELNLDCFRTVRQLAGLVAGKLRPNRKNSWTCPQR